MSNGKDDKPKGPSGGLPGSAASGSQPKRPAPTIDLEAKVIETRDLPGATKPADATGSAASGESAAAPGNKPATGQTSEKASANSGPPGAAKPADAGSAATASGPSPSVAAKATGTSPKVDAAKPAESRAADNRKVEPTSAVSGQGPASRGGFGRFVGHLASGAAGALLALFGADYAARTIGVGLPTPNAGVLESYGNRIGTLEQLVRENAIDAADSDVRARLKVIKSEIEALQASAKSVGTLQSQQQLLADKTADLEQKLGGLEASAIGERISRLEQTLAALSNAGGEESAGKIPQIANLLERIDDLEARIEDKLIALTGKVAAVSSNVELDTLKAAGQQLGSELATVKAHAGMLDQNIAALEAGTSQIRKDIATLREETLSLKSGLDGRLGSLARAEQIAALKDEIGSVKSELADIAGKDAQRDAGANRILLSLELANLKRAIERGGGFERELAQVRGLAPKEIDLAALQRYARDGLPTDQELEGEFRSVARAVLAADMAPDDASSLLDRLWAGARSVVHVRKTGNVEGDSTEAVIARMEARLQSGDLEGTLLESQGLTGDARSAAEPWLDKLAARLEVDRVIAGIDDELKKLMGAAPAN